ncbi:MAG: BREX-1 system adenine-specific DNA-methyltransferase PglX [Methylomicrobium sp.]
MNTNNLKKYAPQARRDFMAAVSQRLNQFGIAQDDKGKLTVSTPVISGSVMQIEGMSFDAGLARAREKLVQRAKQMGFEQLVEQMAYTWFNRLSAIRFMELHGYLDHNLRVLSHPEKAGAFEILNHCQDVAADLGLDRNQIVELKLAGNQDEALYRLLLLGQCHQLHQAMPFLFEALDDETELLLPDNLTRTDSILRGLVDSIPEDDWQQVEIIGWLYQFYISEKKDQVIGSVVKSEDIPAATQLFTPNWIVKYLVQNSIGRQWLMTYPDSGLKAQMQYYIEPAEQEPSVVEALAAITPVSIDPETIKVLDPACGSGHILVEAYDILKAIYEERGYRVRDIPKLILEKNLYGLDIDDRAAQLAGFALMMKAREDDRRIFSRDIKLNILAIQATENLDLPDLWRKLALNQDAKRGSMESIFDDVQNNLADTVDDIEFKQLWSILALFEQAKTLGSLIQVPHEHAEYLRNQTNRLRELNEQGDSMQKQATTTLLPYVQQAWLLAQQYDAVVANPPYMGNKGLNDDLRRFREKHPLSKYDLFSMFIEKGTNLAKKSGFAAFVVPQSWMFLTTFSGFRKQLIENKTISTLNHFDGELLGIGFKVSAFCFVNNKIKKYQSTFQRNIDGDIQTGKVDYDNLDVIPGWPLAYWASDEILLAFKNGKSFGEEVKPKAGMLTTNNSLFVRCWWEVDYSKINRLAMNADEAMTSKCKWFPYNKGGGHRRWYGNDLFVVNFIKNGQEICDYIDNQPNVKVKSNGRVTNRDFYFRKSITWSDIGFSDFSARMQPEGNIFDITGMSAFPDEEIYHFVLAFLCSSLMTKFMGILNPTFHFQAGDMARIPLLKPDKVNAESIKENVLQCISIAKEDWDTQEISHDFKYYCYKGGNNILNDASILQKKFEKYCKDITSYEAKNDGILECIYGFKSIDNSLTNQPEKALLVKNFFNDNGNFDVLTFKAKFAIDTVSYALGCMMGRYSLDEPGLIYAHAGNIDFDPSRYPSFPADEDGILPLTDQEWFKDDATNRFREFLVAVWGEDTLQQNLEFVAESLTLSSFKPKKGETSLDTVRRYLSNQFYKDHLQTYKKRPIYWLFSSGKQKAFECLVYLHRYNESTLARMRTEYVTPLLGKYSAYAEQLNQQLQDASSSEATRIKKDIQALEKKQTELRQFDDKLKHYADMRIKLDLDDGVKVNYSKFGDLLAEVKAVTGGTGD